ncbi:hypothetical protein SAMN06298216_0478 [Spirosomataceae bacterium TFI 002]|nr:hypothetical protein SAMN06298216_0478 [Spirosomataceae bacterium TFI 002]
MKIANGRSLRFEVEEFWRREFEEGSGKFEIRS